MIGFLAPLGHPALSVCLIGCIRIVIWFGQQTVAVVRRVFAKRNGIVGKILLPMPSKVLAGVIPEVELVICLAAASEQLDVVRRIAGDLECLGFLAKGVGPKVGIELAVAEMICLFNKYMKQGELLNYVPEFCH